MKIDHDIFNPEESNWNNMFLDQINNYVNTSIY